MPSAKPNDGEDTYSEMRRPVGDMGMLPRRIERINACLIERIVQFSEAIDHSAADIVPVLGRRSPIAVRAEGRGGRIAPQVDDFALLFVRLFAT